MTPRREEFELLGVQSELPLDLKTRRDAEKRGDAKKRAARTHRDTGKCLEPLETPLDPRRERRVKMLAETRAKKRQDGGKASKAETAVLPASLKRIRLNAAGVDIGAYTHYVAVPEDRDPSPVRHFSSFTVDLESMADWLESCGIETVAMESTGVYWIPLYDTLEKRGFEVLLVNPYQLRYAPARKSDVLDCQWIQELHTCGLLTGAFRPDEKFCALRSYVRQRDRHLKHRATQVQCIQKALAEMNVQLKAVLSDVVGVTGLRILRAIVGGERDPQVLALLRDGRCRHDEETIAKALEGTWREEHLFAVEQALELYELYEEKIAACDLRIEAQLATLEDRFERPEPAEGSEKKRYGRDGANPFSFNAHSHLERIAGVDLTAVPGIGAPVAMKVLSETGTDVTRWRHAGAFCSWMGLCPGSKVTGGKRLSSKSKPCANRAAAAFRLAAYGLQRSNSYLGAYYRRMKGRLGAPKAITATAHKLARIVYAMLRDGSEYKELGADHYENTYRRRAERNLKRNAEKLGYCLVPLDETSDETTLVV
jgi:transposase